MIAFLIILATCMPLTYLLTRLIYRDWREWNEWCEKHEARGREARRVDALIGLMKDKRY